VLTAINLKNGDRVCRVAVDEVARRCPRRRRQLVPRQLVPLQSFLLPEIYSRDKSVEAEVEVEMGQFELAETEAERYLHFRENSQM
jgi:hypothetical protein